jgi:hypothetical protein
LAGIAPPLALAAEAMPEIVIVNPVADKYETSCAAAGGKT